MGWRPNSSTMDWVKNESERRQHLIEVIARVEFPHHDIFDDHAGERRGREAGGNGQKERAGEFRRRRGRVGADHVERAMREIDDAHDAEHERQSRRQQEQHDAELHAVQSLFENERHGVLSETTPSLRAERSNPGTGAKPCVARKRSAPRDSGLLRRLRSSQ
jgi:hypothetical protein